MRYAWCVMRSSAELRRPDARRQEAGNLVLARKIDTRGAGLRAKTVNCLLLTDCGTLQGLSLLLLVLASTSSGRG
jgi:hypothetical protein